MESNAVILLVKYCQVFRKVSKIHEQHPEQLHTAAHEEEGCCLLFLPSASCQFLSPTSGSFQSYPGVKCTANKTIVSACLYRTIFAGSEWLHICGLSWVPLRSYSYIHSHQVAARGRRHNVVLLTTTSISSRGDDDVTLLAILIIREAPSKRKEKALFVVIFVNYGYIRSYCLPISGLWNAINPLEFITATILLLFQNSSKQKLLPGFSSKSLLISFTLQWTAKFYFIGWCVLFWPE